MLRWSRSLALLAALVCCGGTNRAVALDSHSATSSGAAFAGLEEALHRFVPEDEDTARQRRSIQEWHAAPENKGRPRAAVFVLAQSIHCGPLCESPWVKKHGHGGASGASHCTQATSVVNLARSLQINLFDDWPYPLVIFHEDWLPADKQQVEAVVKVKVFWMRVRMDDQTLPSYYEANRELVYKGMLTLPGVVNTTAHPWWHKDTLHHGYGYRNMCRFFAGLIFHSPLMREFDFYMRLDGGDSRLGRVRADPFQTMQDKNLTYGWQKHMAIGPAAMNLMKSHIGDWTDAHPDSWKRDTGDFVAKNDVFYNNFEVVRTAPFKTPQHWEFFRLYDKTGRFFCDNVRSCGPMFTGDAEFRSLSLYLLAESKEVFNMGESILYRHPVPNWCAETKADEKKNRQHLSTYVSKQRGAGFLKHEGKSLGRELPEPQNPQPAQQAMHHKHKKASRSHAHHQGTPGNY